MLRQLCDPESSNPVIILNNRIYRVTGQGASRLQFVNFGGVFQGISEGERLTDCESRVMQDDVDQELEKIKLTLEEKKEKLASNGNTTTNRVQRNNIEQFIQEFIENYHRTDKRSADLRRKKAVQGAAAYESRFPTRWRLHRYSSKEPIIGKCFDKKGIMIFGNDVYTLSYSRQNADTDSYVSMNGSNYSIQPFSGFEQLEKAYGDELKKVIQECSSTLKSKMDTDLGFFKRAIEQNLYDNSAIPKENKTHDVGWMQDGNDYYVYCILKNPYELVSDEVGKRFLFPSCQLGLRLKNTSSGVTYDKTSSKGKIRVLATRTIKDGRQVAGDMHSLKNKIFKHPTSPSPTQSDGWGRRFPYLCIGDGDNQDIWPTPNSKSNLGDCIRHIFSRAICSAQYYVDTTHKDYNPIFCPLNFDTTNYFENNRIR